MKSLDRAEILSVLKRNLSSARFKHTLGVEKIAMDLAKKNGCSVEKAAVAALLHDVGKFSSHAMMISYVKKNRIHVPLLKEVIKYSPALLHGYIGAHIARKRFGIKDKNVLSAISAHTIGSKKMGILEKIIYVADAIAPDRRHSTVKPLRRMAYRNLAKAVFATMQLKIHHVIINEKWIHPQAVGSWNSMLNELTNED